jgi:hypothetical protein
MSFLKTVDRIAMVSLLSVFVGVPYAAVACSTERAASSATSTVQLPDGGERRFYTTGPAGTTTCRVDVSSAGRILGAAQVLGEGNFYKVMKGMSAEEVLASIGPPARKMRFEATRTTSWDYHFSDLWNYDSDFSVIVDDAGIIVGKVTVRNGQ